MEVMVFCTDHVVHEIEGNHEIDDKEKWTSRESVIWSQCDIWIAEEREQGH